MDENRDDRQNNYGYHYGEGFTMRGAMPEDYQQADRPAEPQRPASSDPRPEPPRYYNNDATYQNGYDGGYRQTYENRDFREDYRGGISRQKGRRRFGNGDHGSGSRQFCPEDHEMHRSD